MSNGKRGRVDGVEVVWSDRFLFCGPSGGYALLRGIRVVSGEANIIPSGVCFLLFFYPLEIATSEM